MKKLLVIYLFLIISISSFSQQTNSQQDISQEFYLKKSKTQKTTAWILLGGGAILTSAGLVIGFNEALVQFGGIFTTEEEKTSNAGEVLFYTGLVSMAGSIPFLIASSKNKKKAGSISTSIKMESRTNIQQQTFVRSSYPAVSVKFSL